MKNLLSTLVLLLLAISSQAKGSHKYYGRHIITVAALANNAGPGVGLQYENVRPSDRISWIVPAYFCFSRVKPSLSHSGNEGETLRPLMFFISPGFRFYPTRSSGVARYSLGANLIIGRGKGAGNYYINNTNQLKDRSIVGISIANAINFQIGPNIRTGLEFSLGIVNDNGVNSATGEDTNPFGQLLFNLGYRF